MDYDITLKELPATLALTAHKRTGMADIPAAMGEAFGAIMACAEAGGAQYAGPPFCLYPGEMGDEIDMVLCMPVAPGAAGGPGVEVEDIPGGLVASVMHVGSYAGLRDAYGALQVWMAENGRRPAGPPREIYLSDPGSVPESVLLTEVAWPVF